MLDVNMAEDMWILAIHEGNGRGRMFVRNGSIFLFNKQADAVAFAQTTGEKGLATAQSTSWEDLLQLLRDAAAYGAHGVGIDPVLKVATRTFRAVPIEDVMREVQAVIDGHPYPSRN